MQQDERNSGTRSANTITQVFGRRQALTTLGALGLLGCGAGDPGSGGSASGSGGGGTSGSCALIPQETQGPYPLLTILSNSTMLRLSCAAIAHTAVYIWHCDKDGVYSGYSQPAANTVGATFCRGIQLTDSNGEVAFTTIYPGWYAGRVTHIHFQAYRADNLTVAATATSQIAFPQDITAAVYNSTLYAARGQNTSVASFSADGVFSDGTTYQMATITGDLTSGYTATLTVGIAA